MEAIRTAFGAGVVILCLNSGCAQLGFKPAAQSETKPANRETADEPPLVVDRTHPNSSARDDNVPQEVLDYIAAMDRAAGRGDARTASDERTTFPRPYVEPDPYSTPQWNAREGAGGQSAAWRDPYANRQVPGENHLASMSVSPGGRAQPADSDRPEANAPAAQRAAEVSPPPQPPVLTSVSVEPRAAARLETAPRDAPPPAVNAPLAARNGPASLQEFLAQLPTESDDLPFRQQLDRRLLLVAAGDYVGAREPLALVTDKQQRLASGFVEALIAVREGHMGDPTGAANRALEQISLLSESLRSVSDLSIPNLVLCREVRGYGQYEPFEKLEFPGGRPNEFVAYCEVADFASEQDSGGYFVSKFDLRTTILTASGDIVLELEDPGIVDRCRTRRHDCFIPRLVQLPATLSPGEYVAKVTIADTLGKKVAERRATFRITAR